MPDRRGEGRNRRLPVFYVAVLAVAAGLIAFGVVKGQDEHAAPSIAGSYGVTAGKECLGADFNVVQSGQFVHLQSTAGGLAGNLRYREGRLSGTVECASGGSEPLKAKADGQAITGTLAGSPVKATFQQEPPAPGSPQPLAPGSVDGGYTTSPRSACVGGAFVLNGGGSVVTLVSGGVDRGQLSYSAGALTGTVTCSSGQRAKLAGQASNRTIDLTLVPVSGTPGQAKAGAISPIPATGEHVTATKTRDFGGTLAAFFIAVAVVMLVARLFGVLAGRIAQPRVMGEVVAGIVLGPTILGLISPSLEASLFPIDIVPTIGVVANLGLIFYMFLVGLELDPRQLRGRIGQALAISNASVALPMGLGVAIAVPIYTLLAPPTKFVGFALFMGVAMSITAFPVLARILVERRMLKRPVGAMAMASAAIDDVTAWFLVAVASAVAFSGSGTGVVRTILEAGAFCVVMFLVVRPLIARVSSAYDEAGRVPAGWIAAIFAGVLLSAYATETIGIAVIFGAFVMGLVMPRHAGLTEDVTGRMEDLVVTLLLPLFFAYTGLKTNVGLLDNGELWLITAALVGVAIAGKFLGAALSARVAGLGWRASSVLGTLMNTRGLTELIVLNLALDKGVISQALFTSLVIMALVTTFMAGPLLRLIDPRNIFGAPVEEELEEARQASETRFPTLAVPERAILVAPQSDAALVQLRSLAEPLARSEPPRELILARLIPPPRGAATGARGGLQTENRLLEEATELIVAVRDDLVKEGVAARAAAFISADPGADLSRMARTEEVDLLLIDGRRPLLGEGVPRGDVGAVLREAPCDVGVLVAREGEAVRPSRDAAAVVPFGGAEHDWAALELGSWIAAATGAPLRLLGAAGDDAETSRVSRLLADAGLLVQQYAGIPSQPVVTEPGRAGVVEASQGAGLMVIGLSTRWREEGLGPTRSEIARAAAAPILFVRRGTRPGALAPREDVTRFTWSAPGMVPSGLGGGMR